MDRDGLGRQWGRIGIIIGRCRAFGADRGKVEEMSRLWCHPVLHPLCSVLPLQRGSRHVFVVYHPYRCDYIDDFFGGISLLGAGNERNPFASLRGLKVENRLLRAFLAWWRLSCWLEVHRGEKGGTSR